jgi:anti-anti-sigma factor
VSPTVLRPSTTPSLQFLISGATPGTVVVAVAGELDLSNAHILRVRLLAAVRDRHPSCLDLDMAGVTFMDCSTIRVLLMVRTTAEKSGCRMRILNPQPIVVRVLEVLGVLEMFTAA